MRQVIYGENASGKTRYCMEIADTFRKKGLKVVSNILNINKNYNYIPDGVKKQALIDYCEDARKYFNGTLIDYPEDAGYLFNLVTSQGDILIIDDMEALLPNYIFERVINLLREDAVLGDLWGDVIVSGSLKTNINLMNDLALSGIVFINNTDIIKTNTWEEFEDEYYRIKCGAQ